MPESITAIRDTERLLELLERTDCHYCGGTLETGEYKGTGAILCRDCGSPAIRIW